MRPRQAAGRVFEAGEVMWGDKWKLCAACTPTCSPVSCSEGEAGACKERCSLQTQILKWRAVGVTNTAPQSFDLGQMLTCWRKEWEKCTSLPRAKGGWAQFSVSSTLCFAALREVLTCYEMLEMCIKNHLLLYNTVPIYSFSALQWIIDSWRWNAFLFCSKLFT